MKRPKDTGKMTASEIRQAAYRAIVRELGPSGLLRFVQDTSLGSGGYLKDRKQFLPKVNVREIARLAKASREAKKGGKREKN